MKVGLFFFSVLFISNVVFAQQNIYNVRPTSQGEPLKANTTSQGTSNEIKKLNNSRATESMWLNYALDYADLIGQGPFQSFFIIFPDTNIIMTDRKGVEPSNAFYAATKLDPYHMPTTWLTPGTNYSLDSIAFQYAYIQKLDTSIVDTVEFAVIKNIDSYVGYVNANHDTLIWQNVHYDSTKNSVVDSEVWQTFRYPLTIKDTTSERSGGFTNKLLKFAVPGIPTIYHPDLIGLAIGFKPGYSHSKANLDTIFNMNMFLLLSSEANGLITFPTYNKIDRNTSYMVVNYNAKSFTPGGAFSDPRFGAENHLIYFHVTTDNLGTSDLSVSNGLNFYPNPALDKANIYYRLNQGARKISLKLFDLAGREQMSYDEVNIQSGEHRVEFNTGALTSGMYFYSFSIDGKVSSGKFIVK